MTSPRAVERLAPLIARGMVLDLDAMRAALHAFGDPQEKIPCVHVAGTNGKGSVTATVDAVLRATGRRVGRYTSPHLHRFAERIAVDGDPLPEDEAIAHADAVLAAIAAGEIPSLTFFEAVTLMAWRAFAARGCDIAVVEVGLGGRLDATTVCAPAVTVITRIAMDHMALLGDTLDAIAREKAGILKPGVPCVLGPALREGVARAAIESVARVVGAPLLDAPTVTVRDVDAWGRATVDVPWNGAVHTLTANLAGGYQVENLATAVGACAALVARGVAIDDDAVARGVASVTWPARMERIGDVVFDAAHNVDGVTALLDAVRAVPVGALVFGASRDKDVGGMLALLGARVPASRRFYAAAALARAAEPDGLAGVADGTACASPAEALARARAACAPGEVTLVCGSIFTVAAVRAVWLGIDADPPVAM